MTNPQPQPSMPPPPPGYSASDVVATPATPATQQQSSTPPPPPPGYSASDVVASAPPNVSSTPSSQPAPQGTISATPGSMPNDPMAAKIANWASNVSSDMEHGTSITGVGKFLKSMGAHGFEVGNSKQVGD